MLVRRWGLAVALGLSACGKSASEGSNDLVGVGGAAKGESPASGGRTSGGTDANAGADASGAPIAGAAASGVGGIASLAGAGVSATSGGDGGGAGGLAALGPDPQPAALPVAVVATSNSYLVFGQGTKVSDIKLMLLDLKGSGQPIQVNSMGSKLILPTISADGRLLVHVQTDPFQGPVHGVLPVPPADDLQFAAFTDSGYSPGTAITGFEGLAAMRYPAGFDAESRFVAFVRTGKIPGLDIVDLANHRRYGSLNDQPIKGSVGWAPKGYLFAYRAETNAAVSAVARLHVAKLIDGGISEPQALPEGISQASFSADGQRLFYSVDDGKVPLAFGYVDPPAAPRQIYSGTGPNGFIGFEIEAGEQSLLTTLIDPNNSGRPIVTRIFVDPARPPQPITEATSITMSESGSLAALWLIGDTTQRIEFLRGTERIKVVEAPSVGGTFTGEHLVYYPAASEADPFWEVRSATLVGSSVVDRRLFPADRHIISFCQQRVPNPGNKYVDIYDQPGPGIRFSDLELDGPGASRTIEATDPSATIDCPVCDIAGDACAYVEWTDTSSKIFIVHYGATGPSAPTLAFQSDQRLTLHLAHLP